jgi:hypothetical protein
MNVRALRVGRVLRGLSAQSTLLCVSLCALCVLCVAVPAAHAQQPPAGPGNDSVPPAEIQRLFDAYALVQAQAQLKLSDDQYPSFLALQDLDVQAAADVRKAYDAVDQVLDLRQQAKFRVFEEQMERRKIDLVTRARQNNRQNRGNQ